MLKLLKGDWTVFVVKPGWVILKVITTQVDLLFIELSHVKQMYSQPIHLTHCVYKSQEEGYIFMEIPQ